MGCHFGLMVSSWVTNEERENPQFFYRHLRSHNSFVVLMLVYQSGRIMTLSHLTRAFGLVTLLKSSLSTLQATELTRFDDLTDDALLSIMHFLPDRDIGAMAMTSSTPYEVSHGAFFSMISGMTLNRGTGEDHNRLQDLPTLRVQQILGQIIEEDQYLAVPMNSPLCTIMPDTLKLADLADWREQLPLAMPLYKAAFGKDLPEVRVDLALQHLLAVLDNRVYVQRSNVNESFARFAAKKTQDLMQKLQNQRQARPFVNFLHGDVDRAFLAAQAHTIVLSDAELDLPETKQKLEQLLNTQSDDLTQQVVLNVGRNPQLIESGDLCLRSDELQFQVRHLTVTNPGANVTTIGHLFLAKHSQEINMDTLSELRLLGFQRVTLIGYNFLSNCRRLTTVDISSFRNVGHIGTNFLSGCSGLTSVDLSAFKNVTSIGSGFLSGCHSLSTVDLSEFSNVPQINNDFLRDCSSLASVNLSGFTNVTSIGDFFLRDCSDLTSVDLSALKNVTKIGWAFLFGCSGLTSVDLRVFRAVSVIDMGFLNKCSSLTSVDLTGLTKVNRIDPPFLAFCPALTPEAQEHIRAFCKQRGVAWKPEYGRV
ncbi:MAG: leucine-rich repeat domain-containing protein [Holosporales bacterium]